MTFSQQDDAQKLLQTLARLEVPGESEIPDTGDDAVLRAIEDASQLYQFIEQAREILKGKRS